MDLLTNSLLSDLLDKALECPVCLEPLDTTARVLPCQHTFCRRCLLEIVHSRRQLLCPECRVQCDLNVDELPPNILLIRLLEGIKSNKRQSTERNDSQNVNEMLSPGPQSSPIGVGGVSNGQQSMSSHSVNQLFNTCPQTISQTTPHLQPNQSQTTPQPPQQQQCIVKQSVPIHNSLPIVPTVPSVKTLYNFEGKELEIFVALYNYRPQKTDELELKKGELYSVTKKCYDGWFRGLSVRNGATGAFPGNYVQLVKPTAPTSTPIAQYPCPVNTGITQSIQSNPQSMPKEPPIPKPKPVIHTKPSISLSTNVTPIDSNTQTTGPQPNSTANNDNVIVYARPRPTGQSFYDVSRSVTALVPPPPPNQRPTRPLSSILVPNTKASDDSVQNQLAQALNQSLLISKAQSASQSSLNQSTQWHQPKVAATRNTHSLVVNSSMQSSATAITPPPNVSVMSTSISITQSGHKPPTDRKESKPKEKTSNFIKRFTQSKPKRKHQNNNNNMSHNNGSNHSISCDNPSFVDTQTQLNGLVPIHQRSGSCPNESLTDFGSHKKQSSFDDSNTVIKNRMCMSSMISAKDSAHTSQPIAPPLVRERFRCVVPYPPNSEYELELQVGDIVYVHKKREDGWYKGTLQRTGKTGLFPGPFVESF